MSEQSSFKGEPDSSVMEEAELSESHSHAIGVAGIDDLELEVKCARLRALASAGEMVLARMGREASS